MKIDIPDLEQDELAPPSERFVGNAEHGALAISAQAFAGADDKFLDVLPAQWMRLILASRSLSSHFL
jgi:hypothetical protein